MRVWGLVTLALVQALMQGGAARGRTLEVGQGGAYPTLGAAAAAVAAGDTIRLAPGEYFECVVLSAPDLVVEGAGSGTVITDRVCEGKALLVARGAHLTVRDLVLARARSPDANGAGIRLEAAGLTVERVRFENDQVGVLDGLGGPEMIRVADCVFEGGGVAGERPSWALWVSGVSLLRVEGSAFTGVRGGQVFSMARRTELVGNRIGIGMEEGAAFAVQAGGTSLVMEDNVLTAGPFAPRLGAAVLATGAEAALQGNRLVNGTGQRMILLLDWTTGDAVLGGNVVETGDQEVSETGIVRHRVGAFARSMEAAARSTAGATLRAMRGVLGR